MDSDNATQIIVAALTSGFLGWALPALGKRFASWRAGAEKRKRSDLDRMAADKAEAEQDLAAALADKRAAEVARREAEERADAEASKRRIYAESLSHHRRVIIETVGNDALPKYPI